ncbi:aspartate kinase [Paraburkholderia phymatum]|uniref:Tetrahydromethanopterin biosynthesis protein, putative kinase n=1 Tax=Paraburkholderia phymatum (strain DSM 17167 / CIP 108236 / LMG 21445 / STM815) TaxID=391038 RepID=B2JVM5_PARP8|nr:tetrahydromethanopterin biosynthesis protein kinase [Paraburkholderia phymatum]ACC75002.1 tetrahydromethanopterin biosynthesis protein, putative kinase [Paraburkholderia phymatum STM815]
MWVVKIGGSMSRDPLLEEWLTDLVDFGGGRVVIVPGGGDFAEQAREHQDIWRFDDVAAHNMAVLAMAQCALMMHGISRRLVIAATDAQIRAALHAGRVAVWAPLDLLYQEPNRLTSWDVTSDSLAAWLANRLNAERLLIVKSCEIERDRSIDEYAALGIVDRSLAGFTHDAPYPVDLLSRTDGARVRDLLLHATTD